MQGDIYVCNYNSNYYVGEVVNYIRQSKVNLMDIFQKHLFIYFTPFVHIFDEFYDYLEQSILTGDLCDIEEMFTEVRDKGLCRCAYV